VISASLSNNGSGKIDISVKGISKTYNFVMAAYKGIIAVANCTPNNVLVKAVDVETIPVQTNGNYFISSSLWEGNKWSGNVNQGTWFPAVDTVAHFGIDDFSWGQVRTKSEVGTGKKLTIVVQPYLNSGGTNGDMMFLAFGDAWAYYQGKSLGLKFSGGKILVFSVTNSTETILDTISTYSAGEVISASLSNNGSGKIDISVKGISKTYNFVMAAYKGIIAVANCTPNNVLVKAVDVNQFLNIENNYFIVTSFSLSQNFPNPFNPTTTIRYALPTSSRVSLKIYNVLGQQIADLVNTEQSAGWYESVWNANVSSGLYFYQIDAVSTTDSHKRFTQLKKMMLLK
ncbi:MAG: T9SS type A sorting domain-containing protein, partial [Bacteroidetes bacterium]|nr:T9SS type A sorting domain-containing protein [Bacteroidota bacterium]